jgi:hypothetical protein
MKNLILLALLVSSCFLNAQNWMPFNNINEKKHFQSIDSTQTFHGKVNSILSIIPTSITPNNGGFSVNFKKGYNLQLPNRYIQLIKSQMFGDSLFVDSVQSNFFTIDPFGFNVSFPHRYNLNDSIIIGISNSEKIIGIVDSFYTETINGAIDSIVHVNQIVIDSAGTPSFSHPFYNTYFNLSKNNGMVKSINYSELNVASYFKQFIDPDTIKENENFPHMPGDEFLINESSITHGSYDWNSFFYRIDSILFQNQYKTIYYNVHSRNFKPWLPTQPFVFAWSDSIIIDTTKVYAPFESNVIEDSCLNWPFSFCNQEAQEFSTSSGVLNRLSTSSYEIPYISGWSPPSSVINTDSIYTGSQLSSTFLNRKIGMWDESQQLGIAGVGNDRITRILSYSKIGGVIWGTPFNFITDINNNSLVDKENLIYPNPTSNSLNISSSATIDQIEIRDLNGRIVMQLTYSNQIDVSDLPTGVYFIQLIGDKIVIKKFIKK